MSDRKPPAESFWSHVDIGEPDDCWEWVGSRNRGRYGYGQWRGKSAHRCSVEFATGIAPRSDQVVLHLCDNPPCVNPAHLKLGTQKDNMADMLSKGRGPQQGPSCENGHLRTEANTYRYPSGKRECRDCTAAREHKTCLECGKSFHESSLQRHMRNVHGRARAAAIRAEANR